MGRPVVHFEIGCRNSAKSQEFYKKLFDWKIEQFGPAAMIAPEAGGVGGHITELGHEPFHYTTFYVDVDDVAAALAPRALRMEGLVDGLDRAVGADECARVMEPARSAYRAVGAGARFRLDAGEAAGPPAAIWLLESLRAADLGP